MSQSVRRWLLPRVAAGAVLAVIAAVWLQSERAGDGGAGVAAGGGEPGARGDGSPPYSGSVPGSPGVGSPEPLPDEPITPEPAVSAPRHLIGIDSYFPYDARHLALNFSNGVPECYGTAGDTHVRETPDAVIVTIPRIPPPPGNEDVACIDIAVLLSVDITLDDPLGHRAVLDGSRDGVPVPEAEAAYADGPTY